MRPETASATKLSDVTGSPAHAAAGALVESAVVAPLSPAQARLWRADREYPGNPVYNLSFRWDLFGALDAANLERAFNEVVRRHEILRVRILTVDGEPVQLIQPAMTVPIAVKDLRDGPEAQREQEVDQLCSAEARRSFDLTSGPLVRIGLLQVEDERHILTLTVHHIVADGWSIGLIMRDVQALYDSLVVGLASPLPTPLIQYADYVEWLREKAAGRSNAKQLDYWTSKLRDYKPLVLRPEAARQPERTVNGNIVTTLLSREVAAGLNRFASQRNGTMFTVTLAACLALMHRYSGSEDVAVGSAFAGRDRPELEGLIGLFLNQVVLRAGARRDLSFADFSDHARDVVWEALANQDVPFEQVIARLRPEDKPWSDPLVSINFNCYRAYGGTSNIASDFGGVRISPIPSKSQGALYDLNYFLIEREEVWRLSLEYNSDIYDEATAARLLEDFSGCLAKVAADPGCRLSDLEVTAFDNVSSAQSPQTPEDGRGDTVAGNSDEEEGYALPASATQERFWLLAKTVPESTMFNMPASVRVRGNLSLSKLRLGLNELVKRHEVLRTTFTEIDGELMQVISRPSELAVEASDLDIAAANDLSSLLRQSAQQSFDLEKGPLIRVRLFRLAPTDHVLIITLHHIIADGWSHGVLQRELWSIYDDIDHGRDISLAPLEIQYADFASWQRDWLKSEKAQAQMDYWLSQLAPPLPVLNLPTDRPATGQPAQHCAVETLALPDKLVDQLRQLCKRENTTLYVLLLACFSTALSRLSNGENVIIGSPAANRRVETEPLIGPFAGPIALRLSLAGNPSLIEVARRANRATVDALENADLPFEALLNKLRVRSVRGRNPLFQFYFYYQIAFLQPRMVSDLTVEPLPTLSVGTPFELQLAVIERDGAVRANMEYNPDLFDPDSIRQILHYYLEVLQLLVSNAETPIDRLSVPPRIAAAATPAAATTSEYAPPRDDVEAGLVKLWETVFDVPRIGIHDDFFEIGGTSFLAAQMVSGVSRQFGTKIDLSTVVVAPTIALLARAIRTDHAHEQSRIVPIQPNGSRVPLFCIHAGGGHVLHYREMAEVLGDDQPVYGLSAPELDGAKELATVEQLAAAYLRDIRGIQARGPYQICGLSFGGLVAFEIATQLAAAGDRVGVLALFDTGNPLYYRNLPPAKLLAFRITYLSDRIKKYTLNLFRGNLGALFGDVRQFLGSRLSNYGWRMIRSISKLLGRPVPALVRSNFIMFSEIGRRYTPKCYSARLLLFRAEGRTVEYGSNAALGWDEVVEQGVSVHYVPGGHVSMMERPHVISLVEQLTPYLAGASDER